MNNDDKPMQLSALLSRDEAKSSTPATAEDLNCSLMSFDTVDDWGKTKSVSSTQSKLAVLDSERMEKLEGRKSEIESMDGSQTGKEDKPSKRSSKRRSKKDWTMSCPQIEEESADNEENKPASIRQPTRRKSYDHASVGTAEVTIDGKEPTKKRMSRRNSIETSSRPTSSSSLMAQVKKEPSRKISFRKS